MIVDCNPEFGCELVLGIPYAYWLHKNNQLEKVITSKGMKPFYYFCDNVEEKFEFRTISAIKISIRIRIVRRGRTTRLSESECECE